MVDETRRESQDPIPDTIFNSSIGEDWGEAFEAEDFMASPKEDASSEFFLPEDKTVDLPAQVSDSPTKGAKSASGSAQKRFSNLGNSLTTRFCALPLPRRIAFVAAPILVAIALAAFLHKSPTPPVAQQPTSPPKEAATSQHIAEQTPPKPPAPKPQQAVAATPQPEKAAVTSVIPEEKEIRKKWHFPAVIVQAKTDNNQDITILSTDLTLVLKLHPQTMPPSAKDSFVREMIYQFYSNQPADDLRRFSLERGEMTRKLHAWITKQWPGLPLESVSIERYKLL